MSRHVKTQITRGVLEGNDRAAVDVEAWNMSTCRVDAFKYRHPLPFPPSTSCRFKFRDLVVI